MDWLLLQPKCKLMREKVVVYALLLLGVLLLAEPSRAAQERQEQTVKYDDFFVDKALRMDYVFAGDKREQRIYVNELIEEPRWYGRRERLDSLPLAGNGQLTVRSHQSGRVIYRHSFSTLFQEWLTTEEASRTSKSFENVFLVPMPRDTVDVTVELYDYHQRTIAKLEHTVNPQDVLIRKAGYNHVTPYETIQAAEDTTRCIHIAYVAEGYTEEQMPDFMGDVRTAVDALFEHEPFKSLRKSFNIVAVKSASSDSGTSDPTRNVWKNTALGSHFNTFYSERYLTTLHLGRLHDVLAGTPYEHIIILVNTEHYGGGGIYNSYNLSYTKGKHFQPVVVHEFGHSFGGLSDEYEYGDDDPMYFPDVEPWEPNITTQCDFSGKWGNLIDEGKAGLYEGAGYLSKGTYRGEPDCRMRTNEHPVFCSVCQQALTRLIKFYTE